MMLAFNKSYLTGNELRYMGDVMNRGKLSGNGHYTNKCHEFFTERYGFRKVLLTQSCTDALEMVALLLKVGPGDEVILPSYTFVSTANAFALRGATLLFADSEQGSPNIDMDHVRQLVTDRTKVVVVVHYAGVSCNMEPLLELAEKHNLFIVEDAAQAIDSFYGKRPLGSIGHLACFSFHETKNIISGEGGMLVINDDRFARRAEVLWEKGTNRSAFLRGEVDKYSWIDVGSSFLPSEMTAAFLWAQLEELDNIQKKRLAVWDLYQKGLEPLSQDGKLMLPFIPEYASNNAHMFYVMAHSGEERDALMAFLKKDGIQAIFHYIPLHSSPFFEKKYTGRPLTRTQKFSDCILRLPFYTGLSAADVNRVINCINKFYNS